MARITKIEFWKVGRVKVLNCGGAVRFGSNYLEVQENRILLCNISVACVQTSPTFFITCRKWTKKVGDFSDICMQANISVILSVLSCNFLRPQLFKRWMIYIIHRINLYPLDSTIGFPNTYPLDSDLSSV